MGLIQAGKVDAVGRMSDGVIKKLPDAIVTLINKANEVYGTPQLKFTTNALS